MNRFFKLDVGFATRILSMLAAKICVKFMYAVNACQVMCFTKRINYL